MGILAVVVIAVLTAAAFLLWRSRANDASPQGIVLLLAEHKPIDAAHLATLFGAATLRSFQTVTRIPGSALEPNDIPEGDVVLAEPPSFLIQARDTLFLVHNIPKRYSSKQVRLNQNLSELQRSISKHKAWLSVEVLHAEAVTPATRRIVAHVVAGLLGPECIALFHPESKTAIPNGGSQTVDLLRGVDPIVNTFGLCPAQA